MATDSNNKLTKYASATTIVTSDAANMWYGGLYGSSEADAYIVEDTDTGISSIVDEFGNPHPLVYGHVHDGRHADGHTQKIHLVEHVTNQLENQNLADEAVIKRNVLSYPELLHEGQAIPHWEEVDGDKYYYLDLSMSHLGAFKEIENPAGDFSEGDLIRTTSEDYASDGFDFVFGSGSLNDTADGKGTNRFQFDRTKGAFRAGTASADQWNLIEVGDASVAFGEDCTAVGNWSVIGGGSDNAIEHHAHRSVIGGGNYNKIYFDSVCSTIGGGQFNHIGAGTGPSTHSVIAGGQENTISAQTEAGVIGGGTENTILGVGQDFATVSGGTNNSIVPNIKEQAGSYNFIGGGHSNSIGALGSGMLYQGNSQLAGFGVGSAIFGGAENKLGGHYNLIAGGRENILADYDSGKANIGAGGEPGESTREPVKYCGILGGADNIIRKLSVGDIYSQMGIGEPTYYGYSTIVGGKGNIIKLGVGRSAICGGSHNEIDEFIEVFDLTPTNPAGADEYDHHLITRGSTILGGEHNRIGGVISGFYNPFDHTEGLGLQIGSVAQCSIAHGVAAKSYIYNQASHGGGFFPANQPGGGYTDVDGADQVHPYGQRQTSVFVISTEITTGPDPVVNDSQYLTPHGDPQVSPSIAPLALAYSRLDHSLLGGGNTWFRMMVVPPNHVVHAKVYLTLIWNYDNSGPNHPFTIYSEHSALFSRGSDPYGIVRIVDQTTTVPPTGDTAILNYIAPGVGLDPWPKWVAESEDMDNDFSDETGWGLVKFRAFLNFVPDPLGGFINLAEYPVRAVARVEWTQIYQPEMDPGAL